MALTDFFSALVKGGHTADEPADFKIPDTPEISPGMWNTLLPIIKKHPEFFGALTQGAHPKPYVAGELPDEPLYGGSTSPVRPAAAAPLTPQQLLDAYLARMHPTATTATAAPVVTSNPLNDEYTAARDRLSNIAARFQGVKDPVYKTPDAEATLRANISGLKVPTRPNVSELSSDAKGMAALMMAAEMWANPQSLSRSLGAGVRGGVKSLQDEQASQYKMLMDKYGIDANQAAALVAARSQDTAGANAIAGQQFKDLHTGLTSEAGIAEKQGVLAGQKAQTDVLNRHYAEATAQRREAAATASTDRRERDMNNDPILRTLRESATEAELAKLPGGQAIIDRLRLMVKTSDAKEQGKMIVDILSKIEDPGKARAALALMKSHTGMSTEQILQIYDTAINPKK